jgi:Ca-activated chloride channel family protein
MSAGLRGLVLALLILALANPRRPDLQTRIPVDGISVLLVLDTSNSMGTPDFGAADGPSLTRLEAAKLAFRLFAAGGEAQDGTRFEGRPSDRLGLVTFAARCCCKCSTPSRCKAG